MGVGTSSSSVPAHARTFGKYTLLAKLATGGMAEIFLARMKGVAGFEKQVVIKRILPQYADDEQFVAMFLDEARIAARISHPNVCQVYELGEVDGQYFLAMEYLEGIPLTTVLRKVTKDGLPPDLRLVTALVVQACEGLHNAHELKELDGQPIGVVHRDISPQNLFVTIDGTVKVLDFGIAKATGASAKTRTGTVKGKYAYMSPEQLRGEALDRRSDVFALGVVLFESATGRRLFHRDTDYLIFKAITDEPIPSVRDLRPDIPPALAMAAHKSLARNRDERTATARALGQAIARAMEPYGGMMSPLAIAEFVETTFAEEVARVRGKIATAVVESSKRLEGDVPRVDLASESSGALRRSGSHTNSPSVKAEVAARSQARPASPPAGPEQPTERMVGAPGMFMSPPPEEPDESATEVWDSQVKPVPTDEAPTEAAPTDIIDPLIAETASPADTPRSESPVPQLFENEIEPSASRRVPQGPPQTVPLRPALGPALAPIHNQASGTSLMLDELRPRRRVNLWLVAVGMSLLASAAYLFASSPESGGGDVQSTEAVSGFAPLPETVPSSEPASPPQAPPSAAASPPPAPARVDLARPTTAVETAPRSPASRAVQPKPEPRAVAVPAAEAEPEPKAEAPPERREERGERAVPEKRAPTRKEREPREDERDRREERVKAEPGFFTVDALPYATIYIDGKRAGETPLVKVSLSPGRHQVKAVPAVGKAKTISITVETGKVATHRFSW
jgi:serine/threonine-protein kinase